MALTTSAKLELARRMDERLGKMLFTHTSNVADLEPATITSDTIRQWAQLALNRPEPPVQYIIADAQQQRRTAVIRHDFVRSRRQTPTRRAGRKISRRQWQRQNRKTWRGVAVYAEPTDVLKFDGKLIVTPRQYQTLRAAIANQF